ncbi:MAG: helix-turn-helix domain-containing protein [Phycicoccus sp.]
MRQTDTLDGSTSALLSTIRYELATRGMSVRDLVSRSRHGRSAMYRRLSGQVPLTLHDIDEIASILGTSAPELISRAERPGR